MQEEDVVRMVRRVIPRAKNVVVHKDENGNYKFSYGNKYHQRTKLKLVREEENGIS